MAECERAERDIQAGIQTNSKAKATRRLRSAVRPVVESLESRQMLSVAPMLIQAESFDQGGEGVGYHDTEAANLGGAYRTSEGVDIEPCNDTGGGYNVGWTIAGEWLQYTVNVAEAGTYHLDFRMASPATAGKFHVNVDGVNTTGTITAPSTGSWTTWSTISSKQFSLTAGKHVLRVMLDTKGTTGNIGNFNWLKLVQDASSATPTAPAAPSGLTATASSSSAVSLAWTDNASNETGYSVERKTGSSGTYAVIATLGANSTSYSDSGLTASTQYYYRVRAANGTVMSAYSAEASATTQAAPVVPPTTTPTWTNTTFATQNGQFTAEFDATPQAANMDMVMALSNGSTTAFTGLAAIARFNSSGMIDARNGATYSADASVSYTAGTKYHFKLAVNLATRTYDVYVTAGTTTTKIATGYAFRTEQASVTQLNSFTTYNTSGGALITGLVVAATAPVVTAPAAPTGLAATASGANSIVLNWTDNATNETANLVERSADGTTFTQIASLGAGATSYTDSGLSASTKYYYRVRATNAAGNSAYTSVANATTQAAATTGNGTLASNSQAAVNAAIAMPLIRFTRSVTNGAFTNSAWNGGASITLAEAAYAGNTSADARLLQQMRYSMTGGNEIVGNGGFAAQCELWVTGMFAIAKNTPRIWNQLTAAEQAKVDLIMKATLISSAFVTSDTNPYVASGGQQYGLDGDTNLNRDWNPNYRLGMLGGVLTGVSYFGAAQAQNILSTYDHAAFLSQLQSAGLTNLYTTFNWKAANSSSAAPSASTIQSTVRGYKYYGMAVTNPVGIYANLMQFTYGKNVNSGLNGGAGINGAGKIVSGASTLPNQGALGMLTEFDSSDGGGPRSSAGYCYDGYRAATTNTLALISAGLWDNSSTLLQDVAKRMNIGDTDLMYKLQKGYIGYSKGASEGVFDITQTQWGFDYNVPMWDNVIKPYLSGSSATPTAPAAPSGLTATASSSSAITLNWTDNATNETGYSVERKTGSSGTYAVIATLAARSTSYSDSGLTASTQYYYRVRAANGTVMSAYSAEAPATTQAAPVAAPAAPSGLTATASSSSAISLAWTDNASNETGYSVERKTGSSGTYAVIATLGANSTSYSDSGLTASTQYYYRVRAVNGTVASAYSAEASATTQATSTTTAAVLAAGSGFTSATAQPATVGSSSQFGYADKVIARWDTVPYQTVSGQLNVGVVAFHNSGIDRVEFSANGGAWVAARQMTLNPQTGVVEYWVTLDASKFPADGNVEIRAVAYPKVGVPRVLQGATVAENGVNSLFLNTNAAGTLASKAVYVSAKTGSDSNDGSQSRPFQTISKAAAFLGASADGATIYLMEGDYTYSATAGSPVTSNRWLTITRAPGAAKSAVRLVGYVDGGLHTKLVRFSDLTFAPATAGAQTILSSNYSGSSVWVDNCTLIGPGRTVDGYWSYGFAGMYVTDSSITACRDGIAGDIVRNVTITGIGSDAFSGAGLIVNSSVSGTDESGTTFHPDVFQLYTGGALAENYILYGVTARVGTQNGGQGIFCGRATPVANIAIVNCDINNQVGGLNYGSAFSFEDSTTNLYVKDSSFTGPATWRDDFTFVATDVVVENCTFPNGDLVGMVKNPEPGVLIR